MLLMMVSLGARAEVKVLFGVNGTELQPDKDGKVTLGQKELTGGTVIISQEDQKNGTTELTLAVTPDKGYRLAENGLEVYTVAPADISQTRTVKASTKLDIKSEDFKDEASKRTYTATIDSKLALWLKSANFLPQKRDGAKGTPETESGWNGDGYYYITSNGDNSYYLYPAGASYVTYDVGQPYLTTNTTGQVNGSLWIIQFIGTESSYQIKHYGDNKYLTHNTSKSDNASRLRVHLQPEDGGDNSLFTIPVNGTLIYNIVPKKTENDGLSLNPANGNKEGDVGVNSSTVKINGTTYNVGGMIGLYGVSDNNSKWKLTFVKKCVTPEITVDGSGNVTITSVTSEATIYYTNDDTDPATSGTKQEYSASFSLGTATRIRAIAIKDGFTNSDEATYSSVQCKTPTIVLNKENGLTTITPHADNSGAAIYYTTDGSDPTISSTRYEGQFTLPLEATGIKAIASESADGSDASEVVEYVLTKLALPTFSKNGATVTINKPTKDTMERIWKVLQPLKYVTIKTIPIRHQVQPIYKPQLPWQRDFNQTIIKARAYKSGYIKSDVASQNIRKMCKTYYHEQLRWDFTLSCTTEGAKITYTTSTTTSAPNDPTLNNPQ